MATEGSRSGGSAADSYIGSLISLTSKSEIRYEGVLYNINTDESSIGLRDVRSFGTEGRKKDGPQIPPSDKVYEYILFRGSDIKDLQVKSSPTAQTSSPVNNDPAIIQSQHPRPAQASTSLPNSVSSSTTITSMQTSLSGQPATNIQNGAPLHQPGGGNVGTWGPSPSTANGSANGMPTYWQGYYASPNGHLSHQNQQPLMRSPGLSMPNLLQQQTNNYLLQQMPPLQLPSSLQQQVPASHQTQMPSSLQSQIPASSLQAQLPLPLQQQMPSSLQQQMPSSLQPQMPSSLLQQTPYSLQQMPSFLQHQLPSSLQQQLPSSLQQQLPSMNQQMPSSLHQLSHYPSLSTPNENSTLPAPPSLFTSGVSSGPSGISTSTSSSTSTLPSNLPPAFPLLPVTSLTLDAASTSTKTPIDAPVPGNKTPVTSLSPASSLLSGGLDGNALLQPLSTTTTSQASLQNANVPQSLPSNVGAGKPISTQATAPALLTPGHLLNSSSVSSAPPSQTVHKDVEVVQVSSSPTVEPTVSVEPEKKASVLPLATPSRPLYKQNGTPIQTYSGYRGRGRGRGRMNSRPLTTFNEEFDFTAMNEKFKKDEVWGHLGKSSKLHDHQDDGKHGDEDFSQREEDVPKIDIKPVYNKDDFFDSLSSNTLDQESNHGRHRFSEQRKLDTETFGEFPRYRGGRGGHGPGRGNYRGSFNGRGYGRGGYGYGRGRGRGGPNRVS